MNRMVASRFSVSWRAFTIFACAITWLAPNWAVAQSSVTATARDVNRKMAKIYGAGGFKGLPSYGTGILVSPTGYILTCNNHILISSDIRVHLYDGRSYQVKVAAREPDLDLALLKIDADVDFLPHFDIAKEAARPLAVPGDLILALTNCFQVATRDEPMSVQRGFIAAYTELRGRRGEFEAPFVGDVYFLDAVANNPGAAGGALVNRKGELLGVIGRELKNALTNTWINYAVPIQAKAEYLDDNKKSQTIDVARFVEQVMAGKFVARDKSKREERLNYTGFTLVPSVVSVTPPYIEEVVPGSPADQAGLRPDDLIVYVDGELITSVRAFRDAMKYVPPGTEIKIDVQRGTRMHNLRLKVADPKVKAGG